jgi:putative ABC transport system ATP-binding protein
MAEALAQLRVAVNPAIEARDLYRFYHAGEEETLALRGVSLCVLPGERVAVMGPSGSGKSTLLACLSGLDEPDGGYVTVDGERLTRRSENRRAAIRARKIGIVLQSANLLPHLTVAQNVRMQAELAGTGMASDTLADLGLSDRRDAREAELSGGETARAGLAIALAIDPPIVLADEPTGEVDAASEELILAVLERRAKAGGATIVATHSEVLAAWADRVVRLCDGRIVDG